MTTHDSIPGGFVHDLPAGLKASLVSNPRVLATWQDTTPLARNEWIFWIESTKQAAPKSKRIAWGL
jgi:uncharacterized protein YdeI (YjbR/CyaY-like superfamily)